MATLVTFDRQKFKELVLHVCKHMRDQPLFGAIKLNKALYLCDFYGYAMLGAPITGARYMHLPNGPAPTCLVPLREEMLTAEEIEIVNDPICGLTQKRIIHKRDANLSLFSAVEVAFIDQILDLIEKDSGSALSLMTHEHLGWKLTADREEIPYHTIFLSPEAPSSLDIEQAIEIAASTQAA